MRRFFLGILVLATAVLPALPAAAQKTDPIRQEFIKMDDLPIDGWVKGPSILLNDGRKGVKFSRLYAAQKSFLRELQQSGSDPALK